MLCVLVLVDAGIVVAEILLDLHAIRGKYWYILTTAAVYLYICGGGVDDSISGSVDIFVQTVRRLLLMDEISDGGR